MGHRKHLRTNKKFWKETICLHSLHYLKMSFAIKPAFVPTQPSHIETLPHTK
jgi:hypothetical protein